MAEVPGWRRCRDDGGGMAEVWDGERRITELPGSQSHPRRYRRHPSRSPGSAPGAEVLHPRQPLSGPEPPERSRPPGLRSGCSSRLRRHRRALPPASSRCRAGRGRGGPVGIASLATPPCTARHGPRFPGAVPRGSATSGRPVVLPCAAGAAVPVPGVPGAVSLPQESGSAVPGVPEARGRAVTIPGVPGAPVPGVPEARGRAVTIPGVPGAPVPGVPEARGRAVTIPGVPSGGP
ncbi:basic proline-rich protein-like isoform X2 [Poecile atricapillus]|nr:basic proline-rich protein-like isoform X2 [Poecile atricapillus]